MNKKILIVVLFTMFFGFMFTINDSSLFGIDTNSVVYADDEETITRDSKEYEANRFELITYADEAWYAIKKQTGNWIVTAIKDFLWSINMVLAQLVMMIVYQLFSLDIVSLTKDSVTSIASATAGSMITNFLYFSMAIASAGIVVRAYIKQDWSGFFKILTLIVISLALLFSIKSEKFNYVDLVDSISIGFENAILKANPTLSDREGTINLENADIGDADSMRDLATMIENKVFDSVIYKPYLLLQYGQVDEEAIHDEGVDAGISYENGETRVTKYLDADPYTSKGIEKRRDIAKEELNKIGNENIFAGNGFTSASYIISSILTTVIQGIVFFFLALMRVLMQFALILSLISLPIVLIMSLIPTLETLLGAYMKLVMKIVLFRGILLFFILISTSFISLSYSITDASSNIFYRMFVQIIFAVAVIFIYMKREFAFKMFEGASATVNDFGGRTNANMPFNRFRRSQSKESKDENTSSSNVKRQSIGNQKVPNVNRQSPDRSASSGLKGKVTPILSKAKTKLNNAKDHVASVQRGDIPNHEDPYSSEENQNFTDSPYHQQLTGTDDTGTEGGFQQTHLKTGDIDRLDANNVALSPQRNAEPNEPSAEPSRSPSGTPSAEPSRSPSRTPSAEPSRSPSRTPSAELKTENRKGNPYNTMERNSYNSPISSYQGIRDTDYKGVRERQNPIKRNEIGGNKYE
ncbi:MAG TPA: hypothetical protein VK135_02830 [Candidatus Dormibacteraeota bacterium]|nr:hypothetical protein [Candidatus Dormibacteraeota bacterium]